MSVYQLLGGVLAFVAVLGYINHRVLGLPNAVGVAAVGLVLSVGATLVGVSNPEWGAWAAQLVERVDFSDLVLHGMLGVLLFAGSLSTNVRDLAQHWVPVLILATVGVIISAATTGAGLWFVLDILGYPVGLAHCFVFGALISPTDPVAVLSVLKQHALPPRLQATIVGESLFNDGTGVAAFLLALGLAAGAAAPEPGAVALFFARELLGGVSLGVALGAVTLLLLRTVDNAQVEILLTLAVATGGYALADVVGVSAPLAVVAAGLVLGSLAPRYALSSHSQNQLFAFWETVDGLLNLLLFGLVGVIVLALEFDWRHVWVAVGAVPVVLFGRWISVLLPTVMLWPTQRQNMHMVSLMTWGGLRGGISIALALALPPFEGRDYLIAATYGTVVFSLLVQALTLGPLVRWLNTTGRLGRANLPTGQ